MGFRDKLKYTVEEQMRLLRPPHEQSKRLAKANPELTDGLKVGAVQFHKGVSLETVQKAIDRLYAKYVEANNGNGIY